MRSLILISHSAYSRGLLAIALLAVLFAGLTSPTHTHAGAGRINSSDGTMDFEVNFRFPPTSAQIT